MNEKYKYDAYYKKLKNICDENDLVCRINKNGYPISMVVRPMTGPGQQLTMLEMAEDKGFTSPDASMVLYYKDGNLFQKTSETFTISDNLSKKLKNLFKNLYICYLQFFFRNVMELQLLTPEELPVIEDGEGNNSVDDLPDDYEEEDAEDDLMEDAEDVPPMSYDADDHQLADAIKVVRAAGKASVSLLMREMNIGHGTAAALLDALEAIGVIGAYKGAEPREVLPWNYAEEVTDGQV